MKRSASFSEGRKDSIVRGGAGPVGLILLAALIFGTGCSRSTLNYQIAESIGTVGVYEGGEPVESPQMKAEREQREIAESEENVFRSELDEAAAYAASYFYEDAIEVLESIERTENNSGRIDEAVREYTSAMNSLTEYTGEIAHLCFPTLIEDTMRAFDGDERSSIYDSQMVTTKEFKGILEELYKNGYVLIRLSDIAKIFTDERGVSIMERESLMLPPDRKPIIISQDNLSYADVTNGDGIATKLVLDENGDVKALYTDSEGHDLKGDYDLIPILDSFIAEHPDFSYRGARGIVSVSGEEGVFGYMVAQGALMTESQNPETVSRIADALRAGGWEIACAGYSHAYMNDMSLDQLMDDVSQWKEQVGTLVGDASILFYPYGGEVEYPGDKLEYLLENGLIYLCGLWADQNFLELGENYMRQTRRFVDGYTLENAPDYFSAYFNVSTIIDRDR